MLPFHYYQSHSQIPNFQDAVLLFYNLLNPSWPTIHFQKFSPYCILFCLAHANSSDFLLHPIISCFHGLLQPRSDSPCIISFLKVERERTRECYLTVVRRSISDSSFFPRTFSCSCSCFFMSLTRFLFFSFSFFSSSSLCRFFVAICSSFFFRSSSFFFFCSSSSTFSR